MSHELTVWAAKSVGLFYFLALSVGVLAYACWPGNAARFDAAARAVFEEEDQP